MAMVVIVEKDNNKRAIVERTHLGHLEVFWTQRLHDLLVGFDLRRHRRPYAVQNAFERELLHFAFFSRAPFHSNNDDEEVDDDENNNDAHRLAFTTRS